MQLSVVSTQIGLRKDAVKFSPGLPQNRTCGCWRTGNQTVDVYLNSSVIVAGFLFAASSQRQWVKEFAVEASNDNLTYIPWGSYTQANHTDAVLFALPIRASTFRIQIRRYVNHFLNNTGFAMAVRALVSTQQPFSCGCPVLPDGTCCPYMNMTTKSGKCEWCKDPRELNVVMVDACGMCKNGTVSRYDKCVPVTRLSTPPPSLLDFGNVTISTARKWVIDVLTERQVLSIYLMHQQNQVHPCERDPTPRCLATQVSGRVILLANSTILHSFLQSDNGRFVLAMAAEDIQSWTVCTAAGQCTGVIGAVYALGRGFVRVVERLVHFNLNIVPPPFNVVVNIPPVAVPSVAELHTYPHACFLRMDAPAWMQSVMFQCANEDAWVYVNQFNDPMWMIQIPDAAMHDPYCTRFRIKGWPSSGRSVVFAVDRPSKTIRHDILIQQSYAPIQANASFGLAWRPLPSVGDSERIVSIMAASPVGMGFRGLTVAKADGSMIKSTDLPSYALNMSDVCVRGGYEQARRWLLSNADIVSERNMDTLFNRTCAAAGTQQAVLWLVIPALPTQNRRHVAPFSLSVKFELDHIVS